MRKIKVLTDLALRVRELFREFSMAEAEFIDDPEVRIFAHRQRIELVRTANFLEKFARKSWPVSGKAVTK